MIYFKPELKAQFESLPVVGQLISFKYETAQSKADLLNLLHLFLNESENDEENDLIKTSYSIAAHRIYTLLTGQSYESKNKLWI